MGVAVFTSLKSWRATVSAAILASACAGILPCSAQEARSRELPVVWVLATGGTISGRGASSTSLTEYKAGALLGQELVNAVPEIKQYANVKVEQIINVGSPDITLQNWITLANRINGIFAEDRNVAGIVITHGTSTLEETAYFLNLTVKSDRQDLHASCAQRPFEAPACRSFDLVRSLKCHGAEGYHINDTPYDFAFLYGRPAQLAAHRGLCRSGR